MIHLILGVYGHVIPCFMFLWLLIMTSCIICAFSIFITLSCILRCTQGSDGIGVRTARAGGIARGATSRSWGGGPAGVSRPPPVHLRWRQAPEHYKSPAIFVIMSSYKSTMVMYCCIKCWTLIWYPCCIMTTLSTSYLTWVGPGSKWCLAMLSSVEAGWFPVTCER